MNEQNWEAALDAAEAAHRAGNVNQADVAYGQLCDTWPDRADGWYGLGTIALQRSDFDSAETYLSRAADLDAERPEIQFNLALAARGRGDRALEKQRLETCGALAGDAPDVLEAVLRELLRLGAPTAALQAFSNARALSRGAVLLAVEARGATGDWARAVADLQRAATALPDEADVHRALAQTAARLRAFDLAVAAFQRSLELEQPQPVDWLRFADLLLQARQADRANETLHRARDAGASGADLELLQARCDRLVGAANWQDRARKVLSLRAADGDAWQMILEDSADPGDLEACEQLLQADSGSERDRMLMHLACGLAYQRLAESETALAAQADAAIAHFHQGKLLQKQRLQQGGAAYESRATESWFSATLERFQHAPPHSAPTATDLWQPAFIVGMPRSGTTLVERMLGTYAEVATGGEEEALEFVANAYFREAAAGLMPPLEQLTAAGWAELAQAYRERCLLPAGKACRLRTDKMPHNFRYVGLIAQIFPAAPIIWMERDPRDVALSIYARPFPDSHPYACDLQSLGHFMGHVDRLKRHWLGLFPERLHVMSYEQLANQSEVSTRQLATWCGLTWKPEMLAFHESDATSFTFSELQVRAPLNSAGLARWRRYEGHLEPFVAAYIEAGGELPA